jgi:DNA-binding helix-hairpin-helix protein with protein kinase domain
MLLMEGAHPFQGTWHGDGAPTTEQNIFHGRYAYARWGYLGPAENSLSFEIVPPDIAKLFEICFIDGRCFPTLRLTAAQWRAHLEQLDSQLQTCQSTPHHFYSKHLDECPWCESTMERRSAPSSASRQHGADPTAHTDQAAPDAKTTPNSETAPPPSSFQKTVLLLVTTVALIAIVLALTARMLPF